RHRFRLVAAVGSRAVPAGNEPAGRPGGRRYPRGVRQTRGLRGGGWFPRGGMRPSTGIHQPLRQKGAREARDAHAESEATFTGRGIGAGLATGPGWVVSDSLHWGGPTTSVGKDDIEEELIRLRHSFEETLAELDQYAQRIEGEFDAALAGIYRAHGEMLRSL